MSIKVDNAVNRLNQILPLTERQKNLSPELARLHQLILNNYITAGRTLNMKEMSTHIEDVNHAINTLRSNDMVVFDEDDEPVGAYPFTMEQRDHKLKVNGHTLYSMCALDALAVSPMFQVKTHIDSRCHVTGDTISIDQLDQSILNREQTGDVHFAINWNAAANNCCATSLCTEMIFLKDKTTAESWLSEDTENREVFIIEDAVEFASRFFKPLLSSS